jgi:hypothetical protein
MSKYVSAIALLRSWLNSQTPFEVNNRTYKQVFSVSVLSWLTGLSHLIFFGVPHLFNQWRGEALSRVQREIRDEVSFQAREESTKKRRSCDEPESLPNRIYRTLDGVPRSGKWEGGTSNAIAVASLSIFSVWFMDLGTRSYSSYPDIECLENRSSGRP